MSSSKPSEGLVPFDIPDAGKECFTWYKVVGNLHANPNRKPLITLHGGPSACHELLTPLADLTRDYGIPVVFYDQIGNGRSTHLQHKAGDNKFWVVDLFIRELDNLIDYLDLRTKGFDLYGQSWGGMLATQFAVSHPPGLRKLVIADSPASVPLVLEGEKALRAALPPDVLATIERCEREGTTDSDEYKQALMVFSKRHTCRLDPWPEELKIAYNHLIDDPTVSRTM
jgi:proline-specific peptidase